MKNNYKYACFLILLFHETIFASSSSSHFFIEPPNKINIVKNEKKITIKASTIVYKKFLKHINTFNEKQKYYDLIIFKSKENKNFNYKNKINYYIEYIYDHIKCKEFTSQYIQYKENYKWMKMIKKKFHNNKCYNKLIFPFRNKSINELYLCKDGLCGLDYIVIYNFMSSYELQLLLKNN